jgi:hypothetical protein
LKTVFENTEIGRNYKHFIEIRSFNRALWFMSVVLATQEAKAKRSLETSLGNTAGLHFKK